MDTKSEILDYIRRKETTGALLLTGEWGCGKTYFIKEIAKELNELNYGKKCCIAFISLFGIDNTEKLGKKVKDEYFQLSLSNAGKLAAQASKVLDFTRKIAEASNEKFKSNNIATAVKGVEAILSINPADFISVTNTIDNKPFVLIFDDFERCKIDKVDLMGTINDYTENHNIKTIILAAEDKIDNDDYKEFKEKVISSTIKIKSDYKSIIKNIVSNYKTTVNKYKQFLDNNIEVIISAFSDSQCKNLRIVKSVLYNFERVYEVWDSEGIGIDNMPQTLYSFLAIAVEHKSGNYKYDEKHDTYDISANKQQIESNEDPTKKVVSQATARFMIISKYNYNTFSDFFTSLSRWIVNGVWNEGDFIDELKQKYHTKDLNDMEKFLLYHLLELDSTTITKGLKESLEAAYKGDLNCDQLISLIKKIYYLKKIDESIVDKVDYPKIENGFDNRLVKIKDGQINEPTIHSFIEDDQMDDPAKTIVDKIFNLNNKFIAWEGYKEIFNILNGTTQDLSLSRKHSTIDVFDDNLRRLFVYKYDNSTFLGKKDLIRMLCELKLNDSKCSTETQIQESKRNLEKVLCHIKEMINSKSNDKILVFVLNFCKKELENKISRCETNE